MNAITKDSNSFVEFVSRMYYDNCDERMAYGMKPYPTAKSYLKKNRMYLEREYKAIKKT